MTGGVVATGGRERSRAILPSALHEMHRMAEARGRQVIALHIGDPHLGIPESVKEAFTRAIRDGHSYYCDAPGLPALRAALAARIEERTGAAIDVDRLFVTPGSCQAIAAILLSVASDGATVLLPEIHWPMHLQQVAMAGLGARFYETVGSCVPTAEALEAAWAPGVCALVLNSPSNPSGEVIGAASLGKVHEWARRRGVLIINDEAYQDFVFEGEEVSLTTVDAALPLGERIVFSVGTFSKGFSMTGYRLGWVSAPNPERASLLRRVQEAMLVCPSTPVQFAGLAALADRGHLRTHHDYVRATRDAVVAKLAGTNLLWRVPQGGWYAMLDLGSCGGDVDAFCQRLLLEDDVALAPGRAFAPAGHPDAPRLARMALCHERTTTLRALDRVLLRLQRAVA